MKQIFQFFQVFKLFNGQTLRCFCLPIYLMVKNFVMLKPKLSSPKGKYFYQMRNFDSMSRVFVLPWTAPELKQRFFEAILGGLC